MHEANVEILLSWPLERNAVADRNLLGLGVGYLPNLFTLTLANLQMSRSIIYLTLSLRKIMFPC